jgi:hypothetical protein
MKEGWRAVQREYCLGKFDERREGDREKREEREEREEKFQKEGVSRLTSLL